MTVIDFLMIGKKLLRLLRRAAAREMILFTRAPPVRLWRLLRRPGAGGGEIVIARTGMTIAVPVSRPRQEPRRPGLASGRLTEAFFDPLPVGELAAREQ
jgi:hypothetical protein